MRKLLPPTVLTICIGFMIILHFTFPVFRIIIFPFNLFGIILICLGVWISMMCSIRFGREKTTIMTFDIPEVLVTDGLYQYSRNPMYLGMSIIAVGAWIVLGSLLSAFAVIFYLILLDKYYICFEEKVLEKKFGEVYLKYKKQVRRWI